METPTGILNTIGAFYEQINTPKYFNANTTLKRKIDNTINQLINTFKNIHTSITTFSDNNPAYNPKNIDNSITFSSVPDTFHIFKYLPNKSSAGLDNIPPIILKHLPINIIKFYTIIINNCLNNQYYPDCWKLAKILPILKKISHPMT